MAKKEKVAVEKYGNIMEYVRYLTLYDTIDMMGLFLEINEFENNLREELYRTEEERKLYFIEKTVDLLSDLFSISISSKDAEFLVKNRYRISASYFSLFLKEQFEVHGLDAGVIPDISDIFNGIDGAFDFYSIARQRDKSMIRNTVSRMREEGQEVAALISGGFHTEGFKNVMKKRGLSYLVICPKYDGSEERPYIAVLTDKKAAYEGLVDSGEYTLAVSQVFADISRDMTKQIVIDSLRAGVISGEEPDEIISRWSQLYHEAESGLDRKKRNKLTPHKFDLLLAEVRKEWDPEAVVQSGSKKENTVGDALKKIYEITVKKQNSGLPLSMTVDEFVARSGMGREKARKQLNTLWRVGLLERDDENTPYGYSLIKQLQSLPGGENGESVIGEICDITVSVPAEGATGSSIATEMVDKCVMRKNYISDNEARLLKAKIQAKIDTRRVVARFLDFSHRITSMIKEGDGGLKIDQHSDVFSDEKSSEIGKDFRVDLFNTVKLDNGFIVIPFLYLGEYRYFMFKAEKSVTGGKLLRLSELLTESDNGRIKDFNNGFSNGDWLENDNLCGIISGGVEAYILTEEGKRNIIWENAMRREYHAVWTDWDDTVTSKRVKSEDGSILFGTYANLNVINSLMRLNERGISIAIGTRRRRTSRYEVRNNFILAAIMKELDNTLETIAARRGKPGLESDEMNQFMRILGSKVSKTKSAGVVKTAGEEIEARKLALKKDLHDRFGDEEGALLYDILSGVKSKNEKECEVFEGKLAKLLGYGASEKIQRIKKKVAGISGYFENGTVQVSIGMANILGHDKDLSSDAMEKIAKIAKEFEGDENIIADSKGVKFDDSAGDSRIRILLKNTDLLDQYLILLNEKLRSLNTKSDGVRVVAKIDAGSSTPRITILREDIDKEDGIRNYSEEIGVPISRMAKFGDQAQSGQYPEGATEEAIGRRESLEGNDWSALRFEAGFGVERADRSSVFPVLADAKNDEGMLELLDKLNFTPVSKKSEYQKKAERMTRGVSAAVSRVRKEWNELKNRLTLKMRGITTYRAYPDTYEDAYKKSSRWIRKKYRLNQAMGMTTLVGVHGAAGSGKSSTAQGLANLIADELSTAAQIKGIDDWLLQKELRFEGGKGKFYLKEEHQKQVGNISSTALDFASALKAIKEGGGKPVPTPMYDEYAKGSLLLGQGTNKDIVLYNGKQQLRIIKRGDQYFYKVHHDVKYSGSAVDSKEDVAELPLEGETAISLGRTGIVIDLRGEVVKISVRGNDHFIRPVGKDYMVDLPDGRTVELPDMDDNGKEELKNAIYAQDIIKAEGLIFVEGTRIMSEGAINANKAENGLFLPRTPGEKGVDFDETIDLRVYFELRRMRAFQRTEGRGFPIALIDHEIDLYIDQKQLGSEPKAIEMGGDARVHISTQTLPESIWVSHQMGQLAKDERIIEGMGANPEDLRRKLDNIAESEIRRVILDHVAKEGKISYCGNPARFASKKSTHETFKASWLEIKVAKGEASMEGNLLDDYQKIRERGYRIIDPGQIVDMSMAGPLPVERKRGKDVTIEYETLGKVVVQNHIGWLETIYAENIAAIFKKEIPKEMMEAFQKGILVVDDINVAALEVLLSKDFGSSKLKMTNEEIAQKIKKAEEGFQDYIDKFFDLQLRMWRRGIVDVNPNLMERYARIFIDDKEDVVCTAPSTLRIGREALAAFDPQNYLKNDILKKLRSDNLREYYNKKVDELFLEVGYDRDKTNDGSSAKQARMNARRKFYTKFFETELPRGMRTNPRDILSEPLTGSAVPEEEQLFYLHDVKKRDSTDLEDIDRPLRNIGIAHPYIDEMQLDYINQLAFTSLLIRLRRDYLTICDRNSVTPQEAWVQLVLESREHRGDSDFSRLVEVFHEIFMEKDDIHKVISSNAEISRIVKYRYEKPFLDKGLQPPLIRKYAWDVFDNFLSELRNLPENWEEILDEGEEPSGKIKGREDLRSQEKRDALADIKRAMEQNSSTVVLISKGTPPCPKGIVMNWTGPVNKGSRTLHDFYQHMLQGRVQGKSAAALEKDANAFVEKTRGEPVIGRLEVIYELLQKSEGLPFEGGMQELIKRFTDFSIGRMREIHGDDTKKWFTKGAKSLIDVFGRLKIPLFLSTAKPLVTIKTEVEAMGLSDNFVEILTTGEDIEKRSPNKSVHVMRVRRHKEVDASPSQILFIDDNPAGIRKAHLVGAQTLGYIELNGNDNIDIIMQRAEAMIDAGVDNIVIKDFQDQTEILSATGILPLTSPKVMGSYITGREGPVYFEGVAGPKGASFAVKPWGLPVDAVEELSGAQVADVLWKDGGRIGTMTCGGCGLENSPYSSLVHSPWGPMALSDLVNEFPDEILGEESQTQLYPFYFKYLFVAGDPVIWVGLQNGKTIDGLIEKLTELRDVREEAKEAYHKVLKEGHKDEAAAILADYLKKVDTFCDAYLNRIEVDKQETTVYIPAGIIHAAGGGEEGLSLQVHEPEGTRQKSEVWKTGPKYVSNEPKGFMVVEPQQVSSLTLQMVLRDLTREFDREGFDEGVRILREADERFLTDDGKKLRGNKLLKLLRKYPVKDAKFTFKRVTVKPGAKEFVASLEEGPRTIFLHEGKLRVKVADERDAGSKDLLAPDTIVLPPGSPVVELHNTGKDQVVFFIANLPTGEEDPEAVVGSDAKRAPGTFPVSGEEQSKLEEILEDQAGETSEYGVTTEVRELISARLRSGRHFSTGEKRRSRIKAYTGPKGISALIRGGKLKFKVDHVKNGRGEEQLLYPRIGEEEDMPGSVAWLEEENGTYYVHLTSSFWDKYKHRKYLLAQIVAHEYRDNIYQDGVLGKFAHSIAAQDEIEFSSGKAWRAGVSDLNQFYLDYASSRGQKDYLLRLWADYNTDKDPEGTFLKALVKAMLEFNEINKWDRVDMLDKAISTCDLSRHSEEALAVLQKATKVQAAGKEKEIVFFDIDGVLLGIYSDRFIAMAKILKNKFGLKITSDKRLREVADELRKIEYGEPGPAGKTWRRKIMTGGGENGAAFGVKFIERANEVLSGLGIEKTFTLEEFYKELFLAGRKPNKKMLPYMRVLKQKGIKCGIISDRLIGDAPIVKEMIQNAYPGIFDDEDLVFFSSENGVTKHDGLFDVAIKATEKKYNIGKSKYLMFDDNPKVVAIGQRTGVPARNYRFIEEEGIPDPFPFFEGLVSLQDLEAQALSEKGAKGDIPEGFKEPSKILIGVPVAGLSAGEQERLVKRVEAAAGGRGTVVALKGSTPGINVGSLRRMAGRKNAVRIGLLDIRPEEDNWEGTVDAVVGTFVDRATADIFILRGGIDNATEAELIEAANITQPVISLDLYKRSLNEFERDISVLYSRDPGIYNISSEAQSGLAGLKTSGKNKFMVWTSELEKKGLPFAVDIRNRRDALKVVKENDPVKDIVVITDPVILSEVNMKKRNKLIQVYLEKKGLDEVISVNDVICLGKDKAMSIEDIVNGINEKYGEIRPEDIVISGVQNEFQYDDYGKNFTVLNLGSDMQNNMGIYKLMTEMLVLDSKDMTKEFLKRDGENEGWYIYLPPAEPEDYKRLYLEYRRYVEGILVKA